MKGEANTFPSRLDWSSPDVLPDWHSPFSPISNLFDRSRVNNQRPAYAVLVREHALLRIALRVDGQQVDYRHGVKTATDDHDVVMTIDGLLQCVFKCSLSPYR